MERRTRKEPGSQCKQVLLSCMQSKIDLVHSPYLLCRHLRAAGQGNLSMYIRNRGTIGALEDSTHVLIMMSSVALQV